MQFEVDLGGEKDVPTPVWPKWRGLVSFAIRSPVGPRFVPGPFPLLAAASAARPPFPAAPPSEQTPYRPIRHHRLGNGGVSLSADLVWSEEVCVEFDRGPSSARRPSSSSHLPQPARNPLGRLQRRGPAQRGGGLQLELLWPLESTLATAAASSGLAPASATTPASTQKQGAAPWSHSSGGGGSATRCTAQATFPSSAPTMAPAEVGVR